MSLIDQEYILLIMNCEKYRSKAILQKTTWLKNIPTYLCYYHVIGDPGLDSEFDFDNEERILWVKTEDDYLSLPKKVISAFYAIKQTFKFKYIFKTDDDQELIKPRFFDTIVGVLKSAQMKPHYGGQVVDVQIPYLSKYYLLHPELPIDMIIQKTQYCSGRFYFLSSEAITNLVSKRMSIEKECLEDYAIGLNLNPIFKKVITTIISNKIFTDFPEEGVDL